MKKSVVYGSGVVALGVFFLISGWAKNIVVYFLAIALFLDGGFWMIYWLRSPEKVKYLKKNLSLFLSNAIKITLATVLFLQPTRTMQSMITLLGVLLFLSSAYQFVRIKKTVQFVSPSIIRISIFFNSIIAIASLVLILNPQLISSLFNIVFSGFFIILGIFFIVSKKKIFSLFF